MNFNTKMVDELDNQFIDAESYHGGKQDVGFREIALHHLRKVINLQSEEMRGGFWIHKTKMSQGQTLETKEYVPDSRERFGGAVDALHDILLPHFDKTMRVVAGEINQELNKIRDECIAKTKKDDKEILSDEHYKGDDKITVEQYRTAKVRTQRRMFQQLSLLLRRLKYLEGGVWESKE